MRSDFSFKYQYQPGGQVIFMAVERDDSDLVDQLLPRNDILHYSSENINWRPCWVLYGGNQTRECFFFTARSIAVGHQVVPLLRCAKSGGFKPIGGMMLSAAERVKLRQFGGWQKPGNARCW